MQMQFIIHTSLYLQQLNIIGALFLWVGLIRRCQAIFCPRTWVGAACEKKTRSRSRLEKSLEPQQYHITLQHWISWSSFLQWNIILSCHVTVKLILYLIKNNVSGLPIFVHPSTRPEVTAMFDELLHRFLVKPFYSMEIAAI